MMVEKVISCGLDGISGTIVTVEVDASRGLPAYETVGLPDKAVSESRERVRAAIRNCELDVPASRLTINLAPADIKKNGTVYDLPIALGILAAHGRVKPELLRDSMFVGELALDGAIRPVQGAVSMALCAKENGLRRLFLPAENAQEAAQVCGLAAVACRTLTQVADMLTGELEVAETAPERWRAESDGGQNDFKYVRGQYYAKRACEVAAAGGHNMLMIGPPGCGKTFIARALPSIMPDMTFDEAIEITRIHSAAGELRGRLVVQRPFRAPHHTASAASIIGGGTNAQPGEISLAHKGILFLDEMAEFPRAVLEALRQPLEDGIVTVSRVSATSVYPAQFMLVGAMNPCPCGNYGSKKKPCVCPPYKIEQYKRKLSGPLLDRIDIFIEMEEVDFSELHGSAAECSAEVRKRVNDGRGIQLERFKNTPTSCNAHMRQSDIERYCVLTPESRRFFEAAFRERGLSARANARTLRLARTIADLDAKELIDEEHISEALQYRTAEKYWD